MLEVSITYRRDDADSFPVQFAISAGSELVRGDDHLPLRVVLAFKGLQGRCGCAPVLVLVPATVLEVRTSVVVEIAAELAMVDENSRRRRTMQWSTNRM